MSFDGIFLHCVANEINSAVDAHIDKIYQPSKEELVFVLRKKGFVKKLFLTCKSGIARMHFIENSPENPETPPMFCMLLRKHFSAARFTGVYINGFERVAELRFSGTNELGDRTDIRIVCEFIGGASNIILVGNDGKILDAVHRSDIEKSERIVAPGALYEYPAKTEKKDILKEDGENICQTVLNSYGMLSSAVLSSVEGVSPMVAREIVFRSYGEDTPVSEIKDKTPLLRELKALKSVAEKGGTPCIFLKEDGAPADFGFMPLKQYGKTYICEERKSYSELLDGFYFEREKDEIRKRVGGDIERLLKNLISRANKRKNLRIKELEATKDRETLRIYGELLKANIHLLENGSKSARVVNFYDPEMKEIEIPLDPSISIAANAAKYFKEYKKSYNAEQSLKVLIEKDTEETEYLESVLYSLGRASNISEISEIRSELTLSGYIKERAVKHKKTVKTGYKLTEYTSEEGYRIVVGKNNLQNDYITTVLASKNDIWFHTKNIHGSHVVVFSGGAPVSEKTIRFAAKLAAENSKAALSSNVPVDYTPVKYVKKPSGAKAGMVIYTTNKTIYVTPGEDI